MTNSVEVTVIVTSAIWRDHQPTDPKRHTFKVKVRNAANRVTVENRASDKASEIFGKRFPPNENGKRQEWFTSSSMARAKATLKACLHSE